jgi:hypothetical protein
MVAPNDLPDFGYSRARDVRYQWELFWEARSFKLGEGENSPSVVCITCSWRDCFLARKVVKNKPTPSELWEMVLTAIQRPLTGEPQRPKRLLVKPNEGWGYLRRRLTKIGIRLVTKKDLDFPDGFPEWLDAVWQAWHDSGTSPEEME